MSEIYFWLGVIVALAIAMGLIAMWLRKKLIGAPDDQPFTGFTLKDLRALHEQGQLSDEELAAAEEKALARSRSHYLGHTVAPVEEPEDIGHLSTASEEALEGETENLDGLADKNEGDEPRP
ncbi:MAG: hypothetical protein AAF085_01425 [Planctomycetota bacterium]